MKTAAVRVSVSSLILAAVFIATPAFADVRVVEQVAQNGRQLAQTTRWGQSFKVLATTTVQSTAVAITASCGSVQIGQLVSGEFMPGVTWSGTAISNGYQYAGTATTTYPGIEYWILYGTGAGSSCTANDLYSNSSSLSYVNGTAATMIRDVNGFFVPSNQGFDLLFTVCSDATCTVSGSPSGVGPDWSAVALAPPYSAAAAAIATTSALWDSVTFASSTISCATGNVFSDALCSAATFLFVPNPQIVNGYVALASSTLPTRFPFSFFYGFVAVYQGLSASSTANLATVSINFASVDPATSTPFGNILPNVTVLSSSTITQYMPSGFLSLLLTIEAAAIWLLAALFLFYDIRSWLRV